MYRKRPLRPLDVGGHLVAEGDDLHAVELRETLDGRAAAHTQADEGHAHDGNRIAAQLQHVALPLGTCGFREDDRPLLDPVRRVRGGVRRAGEERKTADEKKCCTKERFHGKEVFQGSVHKVRKNSLPLSYRTGKPKAESATSPQFPDTVAQTLYRMKRIAEQFRLDGAVQSVATLGEGFINDTYIVTTERARYVLQRKNRNVFTDIPAMMRNIEGVTSFLREKVRRAGGDPRREVMTVIPTHDGALYYEDAAATIGPRRSSSRIR